MWKLPALQLGGFLARVVPWPVAKLLCRLVALGLFLVDRSARQNVLANLQHVQPHGFKRGRYRPVLRVFQTVIANYYDLVRLPTIDRSSLDGSLDVRGREHLVAAIQAGKGVIVVAPHLGNYSVVPQFAAGLGCPAALVAERVEPPTLFEHLARLRSTLGISIIPAGPGSIRPILRLLHDGGLLILAGDRDVLHQGTRVQFFSAPASLPSGPVVLATRTGAALVPASTIRTSSWHSRVRIEPPIELVRTGNHDEDLRQNMRRTAERLETMIAEAPEQWAVLQRIWEPSVADGRGTGSGATPSIADYSSDESSTRYS